MIRHSKCHYITLKRETPWSKLCLSEIIWRIQFKRKWKKDVLEKRRVGQYSKKWWESEISSTGSFSRPWKEEPLRPWMKSEEWVKIYSPRFDTKYARLVVLLGTSGNVDKVGKDDPANYRSWSFRSQQSSEMFLWKVGSGTSLVAQSLRICLPMQGTRVRSLVQEDPTCCGQTKPVCHKYWDCPPEPVCHNYRSPCT